MNNKTHKLITILACVSLGISALLDFLTLIRIPFGYALFLLFAVIGSLLTIMGLLTRIQVLPIVGMGLRALSRLSLILLPSIARIMNLVAELGALALVILAVTNPRFRKIGRKLFFIPSVLLSLSGILQPILDSISRFASASFIGTLDSVLIVPGAVALALLSVMTWPVKRKRPAPGYSTPRYAPQPAPGYAPQGNGYSPAPQYAANPYAPQAGANPQAASGDSAYTPPQQEPVSPLVKQLMYLVQPAVAAQLKSPASARFPMELVKVTGNAAQGFQISGFVDSQNSYGAMLRNDFTATVLVVDGQPVVQSVRVGVQAGKQYAKNFAVNYIAISIFVAVAAGLSTLVLFLITGVI